MRAVPTAKPDPEPVVAAITLEQLASDPDPRFAFDRKPVELTAKVARPGRVDNIYRSLTVALTQDGDMTAILGGSPFITALFPTDAIGADKFRTLPPHQEVTVSGELRWASKNIWELHGAKLIKANADPSMAMTATELTQAFVDDKDAAAKKYRDQPLKISGKVSGKPVPFGQYAAVAIAGAVNSDGKATTVIAHFRPEHFNTIGTRDLNQDSLVAILPYHEGDDIEVYGTLQFADFGTGPDGQPGLPLDAYPATWPVK